MDTFYRLYKSILEWKGKHSMLVWCTVLIWGPPALVILLWINCPVTVVLTLVLGVVIVGPVLWVIGIISEERRHLLGDFVSGLQEFCSEGWKY